MLNVIQLKKNNILEKKYFIKYQKSVISYISPK